jgi:hypothetical protein
MTKTQVYRWYRRLWDRITRGDGYQPFGYDVHTMQIVHPGFFSAKKRLHELWCAAD